MTRLPADSLAPPDELIGCSVRAYGALDPTEHGMAFSVGGNPQIGTSATFAIDAGPPSSFAHLMLSPAADAIALQALGLGRTTLLLQLTGLAGPIDVQLDPSGHATGALAIPNDTALVGARVYLQALAVRGGGLDSSNGTELVLCP